MMTVQVRCKLAWSRVALLAILWTPSAVAPATEMPTAEVRADAVDVRQREIVAEDSFFGQYRLRLMLERPQFDGLRHYSKLYGDPSTMFGFGVDWFPSSWTPPFLAIGGTFRSSVYRDSGNASSSATSVKAAKNSPTELTIVPLQAGLTAEFTILPDKWIVFEAWSLIERAYFQEARIGDDAGMIRPMAAWRGATSAESDTNDALVNRGWKNAMVNGVAVNVLLNFLDENSVRSQRGAMGVGYVYLTLFTQVATDAANPGMDFGRHSTGLAFTFESVH